MAGDKLRIKDLFGEGVLDFGSIWGGQINKAIEANEKFENSTKELAKILKKLSELENKRGKNNDKPKEREDNTRKLVEVEKERARLLKNLEKQIAKKSLANSKGAKTVARLREDTKALNAQNRLQGQATSKLAGAYKNLSAQLTIARKEAKNLGAQYGVNSKQFKRAAADVNKLDKRIKSLDAAVGQNQRNVGNYKSAFGGAINSVKRFTAALGVMGGAFLAARIGRDTFNRIREFGKRMFDIAGIMGVTREEISDLEETIKEVASTSIRTSNEVADLAETLVTLGKTKKEVEDLLEPVNNLSIALRATPEQAGELLVTTLNAFQQGTDQAQRFADVIASARQNTALTFQRIRDALTYIGPSAASLNFTLEKTVSILGVLVNNGIKASQAGRVLRTALGRLAKEGITLKEAIQSIADVDTSNINMKDIADSLNAQDPEKQAALLKKLGKSAKLLGQRAAPLALILSKNKEALAALNLEFDNAEGTLDKFIEEQLKSLDSQLKILNSAWEKYLLDVNDASGASNRLTQVVSFLADNLKEVINFVIAATATWVAYKSAILIARVQTALLETSVRSLGTALKANTLGLVLAGLTALYFAAKRLNPTIQELAERNDKAFASFQKTRKEYKKQSSEIQELTDKYEILKHSSKDNKEAQKELSSIMDELNKKVPQATKNFDEYGNIIDISTDSIRKLNREELERQKIIAKGSIESYKEQIKKTREEIDLLTEGGGKLYDTWLFGEKVTESGIFNKPLSVVAFESDKGTVEYEKYVSKLNQTLKDSKKRLNQAEEATKGLNSALEDAENPITAYNKYLGLNISNTEAAILGEEKLQKAIRQRLEELGHGNLTLKEYIDLMEEALAKQKELSDIETYGFSTTAELLKQIRRDQARLNKLQRPGVYDEQRIADIDKTKEDLDDLIKLYEKLTGIKLDAKGATDDETEANKKLLESYQNLQQYLLNRYIETQKDIAADTNVQYEKRQEASENAQEAELVKLKETFKAKLQAEGEFTDEMLKQVTREGLLTYEQRNELNNEQRLAYEEYLDDRMDSFKDFTKRFSEIQKSTGKVENSIITDTIKANMNSRLEAEAEHFKNRTGIYADFRDDDEAARRAYQERKKQIQLEAHEAMLQENLRFAEDMLELSKDLGNDEAISKLKAKIAELKKAIAELGTEGEKSTKKLEASLEEILQGVGQLIYDIQTFGDVQYQNEIQRIEEKGRKQDEYYQNILDNEHLTAAERKRIEKERENQKIATEKKIARVKERQAKFDKAMALVQAAINTAVAITKAGANPVLIALAAASGAAQIAAISSQKIPQYFKGTENHPGGHALVGEQRPEVILEPGKNPYIQEKPAILDLQKGTEVVPSIPEYEQIKRAAMLANVKQDNKRLRQNSAKKTFDEEMYNELILLRKEFKRKNMSVNVKKNIQDIDHELFKFKATNWG